MHAADVLTESIGRSGSIACVGLDPRPSLLPDKLKQRALDAHGPSAEAVAAAFVEFNLAIIDAVASKCAAFKPQVACYEAYGAAGWEALVATIAACHDAGVPVIADAKRNDIGSTAAHYGEAYFDGSVGLDGARLPGLGTSWLTANGYLGSDGITPMLDAAGDGGGVFVLVKTSNPGSGELQDTAAGDATVAATMAGLVDAWGADRLGACGLSDVGAVVGATYPTEARAMRERMPNAIFLVPGYGAQGGGADDAVAGVRAAGDGIVVNSSRGIIGAWQKDGSQDWAAAAADAVDAMNADLGAALART